jgi:phosphohistidine swiveling domain-containing protein
MNEKVYQMTSEYVLPLDDSKATLEVAGGKGASLVRLATAGLPVPDGFHVTTAAYRQFVAESDLQPRILAALEPAGVSPSFDGDLDPARLETASRTIRELFSRAQMPPDVAGAIAQAYASLAGQSPAVAVRSSATAEDLPDLSFAGQQETYLNVQGITAVLEAVKRCWASLWTARAIGYRARHGIDQDTVSLAVVVQVLVPAEVAGVLFTANPVTGQRDQAMISAAWGLGESIVGGSVTPDTLTVDKATGRVLARETADKQVMTVRVDGGTEERPVPEALRRAPVLDDRVAAELTQLGVQIEQLYDQPMDIEWAWVDGELAVVQARPITALPEPEALAVQVPPPTGWKMPDPDGQYMRASIIDLVPDPLTPLFATLGLSSFNAGIKRLTMWIADADSTPFPDETITTINDYAYMIVKYSAAQWWWMLTKMVPAFPRMLRTGIARWRDEVRPAYVETVRRWEAEPPGALSPTELWRGVHEILAIAADHLGALMAGTMGASAGSEGLFTAVYDKMARQEGDLPAPAFLMGYNSIPIQAEKSLYDLAEGCQGSTDLSTHVIDTPARQLADELKELRPPGGVAPEDWQGFYERFQEHLRRFGHVVYDMDFGKPLPLDDPTPMIEACKMYLRGEGRNPHERQGELEARREQAAQTMLDRLRGLRLKLFRMTLGWAQKQAAVREDGLADIGLGYPLLRRMLRELGGRLVARGSIEETDDVFWMVADELEDAVQALEHGEPLPSLVERIWERKAVWRAEKRVTPPPQLPPKGRFMGIKTDAWLAAQEDEQTGDTIQGVAASPGRVTAPACVLHGPQDFDQMRPGHVLVAGITTPAWTPLFAMAAAVVTDVGGPLSHGSIVAREYRIPAVLGTGVATKRIRSGQTITVDGGAGIVTLS